MKEPLGFDILKIFLSFEYRIETVVHVDQMENQKYCSEIAKLKTDTFGQNLVTDPRLRITNTTNNKSSKDGSVSLGNIWGNHRTKFVTELLKDPCLKSSERAMPIWMIKHGLRRH